MNCRDLPEEQLYDYVDGRTLSVEETEAVRRHLESCAECRREEQILRSILSELAPPDEGMRPEKNMIEQFDPFVSLLAESLATRQIPTATKLVLRNIQKVAHLDPNASSATALLDYFAQWMQVTGSAHVGIADYSNLVLLKSSYDRFAATRSRRPFIDCVHLRVVAGHIALDTEQYDTAIRHFSFVVAAEEELSSGDNEDLDLLAVSSHALGHAYRRKGKYGQALAYTEKAIDIAARHQREALTAAFLVSKGWLLFQLNRPGDAEKAFYSAEPVLEAVGDHLSVGNIKGALARICQRQGDYEEALKLQAMAIDHYKAVDADGNIARSLVNIAFLKRLISLGPFVNGRQRRKPGSDTLHKDALKDLDEAERIYNAHADYRGRGNARLVRAFLRMDQRDCDGAIDEAATAYELGKENRDYVLMARALILQCKVDDLQQEIQIPSAEPYRSYIGRARRLAQDAVDLAERTQDTRLIAHSYIWQGITLLNSSPGSRDDAWRCYLKAKARLRPVRDGDILEQYLRNPETASPNESDSLTSITPMRRQREDWMIHELTLLEKRLEAVSRPEDKDENVTRSIVGLSEVQE